MRGRREGGGNRDVRIVEIGGGVGTNALNVLNYLRTHDKELYDSVRCGSGVVPCVCGRP